MARKVRKKAEEPLPDPQLVVPRIEAREKLESRIQAGEELLSAEIRNKEDLDRYREERDVWSDYNAELLRRIFTNSKLSDEYSAPWGGSFQINPSLHQRVEYARNDIRQYLKRLRSVVERLELFPEPSGGQSVEQTEAKPLGRRVFLVHGHDDGAKQTVARFLEKLGLQVTILHEQPNAGKTIIEKFEAHSVDAAFAVILLTDDDVGAAKTKSGSLNPRARQNVILELGYFIGRLGRARVCPLKVQGIEEPSDIHGILYVPLDPSESWKVLLAKEIHASGIDVDLNRAL